MEPFKKGEFVRCIDNSGVFKSLVNGEIYEVADDRLDSMIDIINKGILERGWFSHRFEKLYSNKELL